MGSFHCVPDGCVEIKYQPYTKSSMRYRYPGEDWQAVDGDDYSIDRTLDFGHSFFEIVAEGTFISYRTAGLYYFGFYPFTYSNGDPVEGSSGFKFRGKVANLKLHPVRNNYAVLLEFELEYQGVKSQQFTHFIVHDYYQGIRRSNALTYLIEDPYPYSGFGISGQTSAPKFNTLDGSKPVETCHFTVTKNDQVVHSESRNVCPEVEFNDNDECQLNEQISVIKVEKIPYLERVEVTDYDYQNFGANVVRSNIPDNCLVVRKNNIAQIPPLPGGVPTPHNGPLGQDFTYGFIQQICSDEGCPPPEYEVLCNCEGEKCPTGTCPRQCGNVVCCYDTTTGQAVAEISIENYTGGGLT